MRKIALRSFATVTCGALLSMFLLHGCSEQDLVEPSSQSNLPDANDKGFIVPEPCTQVCLVSGQNTNVGTVDVAVADNGNLFVTYRVTKPGAYLSEVHLDVFSSVEQLKAEKKFSSGGAIPGKFAYAKSWGGKGTEATYTVEVPKAYVDQKSLGSNCFLIASHAALTNGETAWGGMCEESAKGVSLYKAKQFPGSNWGVFFDFCLDKCNKAINFTYAWEDINVDDGNDADYNDLVIQANVVKSAAVLDMTFLATAKGAWYEHKFKIKMPKAGITGISNADYTEEGDYYIITVFNSTQNALPSPSRFANTRTEDGCIAYASKKVTLAVNSSFHYDKSKPYEPFISVYPDLYNTYDLGIYEISNDPKDTYLLKGKRYPNGIMIPRDWKWPLERTIITEAYPEFKSLTDGWNPNWANNLVSPEKTFDASACN